MPCFLFLFNLLCFVTASDLNLNELAFTLQESLLKATNAQMSNRGLASSEQLTRVTDLLMTLMPQTHSPALEFEPPLLLDFGELSVGVPVSRRLKVVNSSSASISISSVMLFDDKQFELSPVPAEINLAPQQSFHLEVVFYPSSIGLEANLVLLNTSVGRVQYFIRTETTVNPYKLEPIVHESLASDSSFAYRMYIFNPHPQAIEVRSAVSSNPNFKVGFTNENFKSWRVKPGGHSQYGVLSLTTNVPGRYTGRVVIDTDIGTLTVPVELQVLKNALRLDHAFVKLGILTNPEATFNFDIFATNLGKKGVAVHEIKAGRSSNKVKARQATSLVSSKDRTVLGSVSVASPRNGVVTGSVLIFTNETAEPMELRYRGEVDAELLTYNRTLLNFYPGNSDSRLVQLTNSRQTPLLVFNFSTSSPELSISSSISSSLGPNESCTFNLSYSGSLAAPKTHYITLQSTFDEILIPVIVHNDQLECNLGGRPCSGYLDLGSVVFESSKVYASTSVIELVNSSPLPKKLKSIEAPQGLKVAVKGLTGVSNLVLKSGESVTVEVTYEHKTVLSVKDPVLVIKTDQQHFLFQIMYTAVKGSLKASPLSFTLKSPSQTQTLVLKVTNRFPVAVAIKDAVYDSKVLDVVLLKTIIKPNSTVDLAKVTFGLNELKFKRRLSALTTLTYEDMNIYSDLEELWSSLSSNAFQINFVTNSTFSLKVPIQASVMKAPLSFVKKLEYGSIFVNSLNEKFIELKNNLGHPVSFQLYLGPDLDTLYENPVVKLQDQVREIKEMTSLEAPSPRPVKQKWDLYGKLAGLYGDLTYNAQSSVLYNQGAALYLGSSKGGVIPPKQSVIIGPLSFLPMTPGLHDATLYIKNNHTFIEEVRLTGKAETSSISISNSAGVEGSSLDFVVTHRDAIGQLTTAYVRSSALDLAFYYDIVLKNTGKLPVKVKDILINGHSCAAFGISISGCGEEFSLGAGQLYRTKLIFKPNFQQESTYGSLLVVTDQGLTEAKLVFTIAEDVFKELDFKALKWHRWTNTELLQTEAVVLLGLMIGGAVLAYLLIEDRRLSLIGAKPKATESNKGSAVSEDSTKALEAKVEDLKEAKPVDMDKPRQDEPAKSEVLANKAERKKSKIRPGKHSPIIVKNSGLKSLDSIDVVATNQLLRHKNPRSKHSYSNSKDSAASTYSQGGLTTPPSEEEPVDDVFLDTYKSKALFGGPMDEEVSSLEELLRD
jgi:hypothetical protein